MQHFMDLPHESCGSYDNLFPDLLSSLEFQGQNVHDKEFSKVSMLCDTNQNKGSSLLAFIHSSTH